MTPPNDWHRLIAIEETLSPLATSLTATVSSTRADNFRDVKQAKADVRLLRNSLTWVQRHRYDALETDMQKQLDIALRSAMAALDRVPTVCTAPGVTTRCLMRTQRLRDL